MIRRFVLFVFLFVFSVSSFAEILYKQSVYLANEPLPKIVKIIKKQNPGISKAEIQKYLRSSLLKVTPEFARKKFNIEWKDNSLPKKYIDFYISTYQEKFNKSYLAGKKNFYPEIAICYMGPKVDYGLFAMEDIGAEHIIVEYTGKIITKRVYFQDYEYVFDLAYVDNGKKRIYEIDAKNSGNASRFALSVFNLSYDPGIFGHENRENFKNAILKHKDKLAVINAKLAEGDEDLMRMSGERKGYILTTSDIKAFEQIGISYGNNYWKSWYKLNKGSCEPCLFDKDGNIISIPLKKVGKIAAFMSRLRKFFRV